eukprot:3376062-Amphidinium_carterae.1
MDFIDGSAAHALAVKIPMVRSVWWSVRVLNECQLSKIPYQICTSSHLLQPQDYIVPLLHARFILPGTPIHLFVATLLESRKIPSTHASIDDCLPSDGM